jgi:hypothetical protein
MARRLRVTLTPAQRRFAAAEIAPIATGAPACERCSGRGFVLTPDHDIDACPDCTRRAEQEWKVQR